MKRIMEVVATIGFVVGGILLLSAPEPLLTGKADAVPAAKVSQEAVSGKRECPETPTRRNAVESE